MHLSRISLTHFKNYASQAADFAEGINGVVGPNGMGKTNLLDAVYYLCMCKSRFPLSDRLLVQHEASFFRLEGRFLREGKPENVTAKYALGRKKEVDRDGAPYERISEHVGRYPVVMIAPDDIQLAMEGSEERRRFLDNTLSQIDAQYLTKLILYNHILRQRNALLRQDVFDEGLLRAFDEQMLTPAAYIYEKRARFAERFAPLFLEHYAAISGGQEQVSCAYRSQMQESPLADLLRDNRHKDQRLQRSTSGAHRDDLQFLIDGYSVKQFASQGQLKSYVLALKLAQYETLRSETGQPPILLLDDLFAKLDRGRVERLMTWLGERSFGQLFISDTELERLSAVTAPLGASVQFFEASKGTLSYL